MEHRILIGSFVDFSHSRQVLGSNNAYVKKLYKDFFRRRCFKLSPTTLYECGDYWQSAPLKNTNVPEYCDGKKYKTERRGCSESRKLKDNAAHNITKNTNSIRWIITFNQNFNLWPQGYDTCKHFTHQYFYLFIFFHWSS